MPRGGVHEGAQGTVNFHQAWALNEPHSLILVWDNAGNQIVGIVDVGTAGQVVKSVPYVLSDTGTLGLDFKDLRVFNEVANCTAGAKQAGMDARFDNFFTQ